MRFFRKKAPNYAEYLEALHKAAPFGNNDDTDLMRDFRRVFLSDPAGRRVLYSILAWGGLYTPETTPTDPNDVNRAEGRRELARHVMFTTFAEVAQPKEIGRNE